MKPQHLHVLREQYNKGAMLFGSEEHEAWVESITEAAPALFEAAELLMDLHEVGEHPPVKFYPVAPKWPPERIERLVRWLRAP